LRRHKHKKAACKLNYRTDQIDYVMDFELFGVLGIVVSMSYLIKFIEKYFHIAQRSTSNLTCLI